MFRALLKVHAEVVSMIIWHGAFSCVELENDVFTSRMSRALKRITRELSRKLAGIMRRLSEASIPFTGVQPTEIRRGFTRRNYSSIT